MATRVISQPNDLRSLTALLGNHAMPFTVNVTKGKPRTSQQNRLQRMWLQEAAEQLGTDTAEGYRGYCKLHFGVPILRAENEAFCERYDEVIRPLPYEHKLRLMVAPFDFGVTRLMTTPQKKQYLDAVQAHLTGLGVALTNPETLK